MAEEYKGYKIEVEQDQFADNPRNWDNLGTMVCFHKKYNLGDEQVVYDQDDFDNWEELKALLVKNGAKIIAPLYLYDHSGLSIKIGEFSGLPEGHKEFDTMQVGFIVANEVDIKREFGKMDDKTLEKVREILKNEVETYDCFLKGDVWVATITEPKECKTCHHIEDELVDSMGDIYGYDEALQSAKDQIDNY